MVHPKPIASPHAAKILKNLQCQGPTNNCGPFTTATILNALRDTQLDGSKLADDMNKIAWRGILPVIRRLPNSATFPWGMVDVFRRHDLRASWSLFTPPEKLVAMLSEGEILMPVIGSWKPLTAHVMTFIEWDEVKGYGFANTQYSTQETYWIPAEKFEKQWKNMGRLLIRIKRMQ